MMTYLYCIFVFMLISALMIMLTPSIKTSGFIANFKSPAQILYLLFFVAATFVFYQYWGASKQLSAWYSHGKSHYQLMTEFQQLGGVNGMIEKIKVRLVKNPGDPQGWYILGRLYMADNNPNAAKRAFEHAMTLDPSNQKIQNYLELLQ